MSHCTAPEVMRAQYTWYVCVRLKCIKIATRCSSPNEISVALEGLMYANRSGSRRVTCMTLRCMISNLFLITIGFTSKSRSGRTIVRNEATISGTDETASKFLITTIERNLFFRKVILTEKNIKNAKNVLFL